MPLRLFLLLSGFALSACAGVPTSTSARPPAAALALDWPASGKPLDHRDLFQNGALKVGLISLQGGARMPEHASPLPVLLTAASGRGTVTTAGATYALDASHAVFLPGGEQHAVIAHEGEVLHIAVVALKAGSTPVEPHGH